MIKLSAIIIDDEEKAINNLTYNINQFCSTKVELIASTTNPVEGIKLVKQHKPDILFLDIQMPIINGFEVLNELPNFYSFLVFVTAHSQYGIRAVKASAFDYLLKPIDPIEFSATIDRMYDLFHKMKNKGLTVEINRTALSLLKNNLSSKDAPNEIMIPQKDLMKKVKVSDILYISGDANYVTIHTKLGKSYVAAKTLKVYEEILDEKLFVRIHKSFLVNKQYVKGTTKKEQHYVILKNDAELPIARRRLKAVLNSL